jgi:hypothetical protein
MAQAYITSRAVSLVASLTELDKKATLGVLLEHFTPKLTDPNYQAYSDAHTVIFSEINKDGSLI